MVVIVTVGMAVVVWAIAATVILKLLHQEVSVIPHDCCRHDFLLPTHGKVHLYLQILCE